MKLTTRPTARAKTAITMALAPKKTPRRGVAAREERMVPLPYSPVMERTPRMPTTREARASPASAVLVGSKPWAAVSPGWWRAPWVARKVTAMAPTTVIRRAHFVERRVSSLAHSALTACRRPARRPGTSSVAVRVIVRPFSGRWRWPEPETALASEDRNSTVSLVSSMKASSREARSGVSSCTVNASRAASSPTSAASMPVTTMDPSSSTLGRAPTRASAVTKR